MAVGDALRGAEAEGNDAQHARIVGTDSLKVNCNFEAALVLLSFIVQVADLLQLSHDGAAEMMVTFGVGRV